MTRDIVLEARNLSKQVSSPEGPLTIVRDVSFAVHARRIGRASWAPRAPANPRCWRCSRDWICRAPGDVCAGRRSRWVHWTRTGGRGCAPQRVGFVFQSFHLVPSLTALENVMLPLELAGRDDARAAAARHARARRAWQRALRHYPRQLSGGEQQRVALARASVGHPAVLFADEPTGNLDTATGERIAQLLFELNRGSDTTLVLVTHDRALAARCERVLSMDAGALLRDVARRRGAQPMRSLHAGAARTAARMALGRAGGAVAVAEHRGGGAQRRRLPGRSHRSRGARCRRARCWRRTCASSPMQPIAADRAGARRSGSG